MARTQLLSTLTNVPMPVAGVAVPLTADTTLYVKSMLVQSKSTNTGVVSLGDSANQEIELDIGRAVTIQGDNMDNGTTAKLQVSSIYVKSSVGGDQVSITVLEYL